MPELNEWGVSYSIITFFERALRGHEKVTSFVRTKDIFFKVTHINGSELNVLLLNEYSLGLAAVLKGIAEFPNLGYIVTGGNWNGYTFEAKDYGRQNDIGIFNIGEFFGALHWTYPKKYYQKDRDGEPVYNYKNP